MVVMFNRRQLCSSHQKKAQSIKVVTNGSIGKVFTAWALASKPAHSHSIVAVNATSLNKTQPTPHDRTLAFVPSLPMSFSHRSMSVMVLLHFKASAMAWWKQWTAAKIECLRCCYGRKSVDAQALQRNLPMWRFSWLLKKWKRLAHVFQSLDNFFQGFLAFAHFGVRRLQRRLICVRVLLIFKASAIALPKRRAPPIGQRFCKANDDKYL